MSIIGLRLHNLRSLTRAIHTTASHYNSATGRVVPAPQSERQAQMRKEFLILESEWESRVDYSKLSDLEKHIHEKHNEAVKNFHFTYDDPETGLKVITRLRHFLKSTCCGNACRHCIYNHQNVDQKFKERKIFNSAFWIDNPNYVESEEDDFL